MCTPIGSKFSIEQMMTTLSSTSRITSISYSFQPMIDSSISTSLIGESVEAAADHRRRTLRGCRRRRAAAAEREAGPDRRTAGRSPCSDLAGFVERVHRPAAADLQADLLHRLLEQLAVFGLGDHVGPGADHLDAELLQHAVRGQVHRQVQPGLAAERRQEGVGPLGLDDLGDDLPGERLDVRAVGHVGVGHDRGRIRVDQHDLVTLFAQGLAGLRARIIELAGLADDDRPGADEQDLVDVVASRHGAGEFVSGEPGALATGVSTA